MNQEEIKKKFNVLFDCDLGVDFLRWLVERSGYQKNKVVIDGETREINLVSTAYNAGQETIYLSLRQVLNDELLKKAEFRG